VIDIPAVTVQALASLADRNMQIAVSDPRPPAAIDEREGERVSGTNAAHGADGAGVLIMGRDASQEIRRQTRATAIQ
jgi:hypothetical protein